MPNTILRTSRNEALAANATTRIAAPPRLLSHTANAAWELSAGRFFLIHSLRKMGDFALKLKLDLATAPAGASDDELRQRFANLKGPMMELSKCKDFVVNKGHYFGTSYFAEEPGLTDDDKRDLIGFLKTL